MATAESAPPPGRTVASEAPACRNCGAAASGRFCPACGQSTTLHPPSVGEFLHEFIAHNIALEGALWTTLGALLLHPGRLTVDYLAGRRARYVAPLRLYLTFSLILFALSSTTNGSDLRFGGVFRIDTEERADTSHAFVVRPPEALAIGALDRAMKRIQALPPAERVARVDKSVKQFLPYVLIALVPVLAAYLMLVYRGRRRLYGEHLVVALHAQTVVFMVGAVIALLPDAPVADALAAILMAALFVHGVLALERVYGGRWTTTVVRTVVLFALYAITCGVAIGILTFASVAG